MRRVFLYSLLACTWLGVAASAGAQSVVPAGTLLQCTLNEPNLSSATANLGDPVVCYLKTVQQFGHIVLPRGSYLEGHVAAEKNPGHFWGKGYLRLEFDRIGLPTTDIPVPSKVIAANGFKGDRQGDIVGKGHAKRDVAEWLFPPLWPWKMITLPARGPRPTLKGEELLTLRLMDDVVVPKMADVRSAPAPGWHYFGEPAAQFGENSRPAGANQISLPLAGQSTGSHPRAAAQPERVTLIVLKSSEVFEVTRYRIDGGRINYVLSSGTPGSADVSDVDWTTTSGLNTARAENEAVELRASY